MSPQPSSSRRPQAQARTGKPGSAQAEGLLSGLTEGAMLATEALFSHGSRLVVDVSHVRHVDHGGLTLVPLDEVFSERDAVFIGFGRPNVYLAVPKRDGSGWQKYAASMFFRQQSYVADTRGRVQGGVFFQLLGLSNATIERIHLAMADHAGQRTLTCARANAEVLAAAGFTSGGAPLGTGVRPMKLARRLWHDGLEFDGRSVELRILRTSTPPVSEHFVGVMAKEATSFGRLAIKLWDKFARRVRARGDSARAPELEPRPLLPVRDHESTDGPQAELLVSTPSRVGAVLSAIWGDHPIFEARHDAGLVDLNDGSYAPLMERLTAYPGELDLVTKLKRYILFSPISVAFIRGQMAAGMQSHGSLPGRTLLSMLKVGTEDAPFLYSGVLTGAGIKISRMENRSHKDIDRANWVLAKHVLLSGYDPDVRFAGDIWVTDTPTGRVLHINNNSGTYKPTAPQARSAAKFLCDALGIDVETHI